MKTEYKNKAMSGEYENKAMATKQKFTFTEHGVVIEAKTMQEAEVLLEEKIKSKNLNK